MAKGRRFPFAGLGYDGSLLNDHLWLKERIDNPILKRLFHSVAGYFVALGLKTIRSGTCEGEDLDDDADHGS